MVIYERVIRGRKFRIASQSVWDPRRGQAITRQAVLGSAEPLPVVDLAQTQVMGTKGIGDVGALIWVAEQLDLVALLDRSFALTGRSTGPTLGEMVVAVALQRACAPGPKTDLAAFLAGSLPRVSCLPPAAFTGQAFHRLAQQVTETDLERVQVVLARAIVERFSLRTDVLAFDTTNFDTHIATPTAGDLARRGHAKSKRRDLRVVGLGLLVSETEHVPLLYRTFPGNSSDQAVLRTCLEGLGKLQDALDGQGPLVATRTLVRDGGFWSPDLEEVLDLVGYSSLISLPLGHKASRLALAHAATPRAMKRLRGRLSPSRAARLRTKVGELDRTLVVIESQELLEGQKRGVAARLKKAKQELRVLERGVQKRKVDRGTLERRVKRILAKEHLATFVVVAVKGSEKNMTLTWSVDAAKRKTLERTRLGRRVLCTDRHRWGTERIVSAAHGQWKVEELFRRSKKGAVVPWGPSHLWADSSLRLHTFATVVGLTLVSLVRVALAPETSALRMMENLREVRTTLVRTRSGSIGRPVTVMLVPERSEEQQRFVEVFDLARWLPALGLSPRETRAKGMKKAVS